MISQPSQARVPRDAALAGLIARASTVLLSAHPSIDDWSRDAVDALRGLVRAREAAILIVADGQRRLAGDPRTARLAERLAFQPDAQERDRAAARIGRCAGVEGTDGATAATSSPSGRYDLAWRMVALDGEGTRLGACCTFAPAVSERTARARARVLEALWPALEFVVRERLARQPTDDEQRHLLHGLPVAAALCTRDGTLSYVNPALARLLAGDGESARLHDAIGRAGAAASTTALAAGEDVAVLRTVRHRYRVRTRRPAADDAADTAQRIVLVEPAAMITAALARPDGAERLRQRYGLTEREYDVARLIHLGHSNQAIATALGISPNTTRHYTERVLVKLGIQSRAALHGMMLDDDAAPGHQRAELADRPAQVAELPETPRRAVGARRAADEAGGGVQACPPSPRPDRVAG